MAAGDGLISMKPTSIVHAGTSASINADGGVDFTAVTSLSLNGVFTSDYDNYLIVLQSIGDFLTWRLRASGSDASGSNYVYQRLDASSTTITGTRYTSETSWLFASGGDQDGHTIHLYGPQLAQPTAMRVVSVISTSGARIYDYAGTHSLSTAYDGLTFAGGSPSTFTGNVHVFGYEE